MRDCRSRSKVPGCDSASSSRKRWRRQSPERTRSLQEIERGEVASKDRPFGNAFIEDEVAVVGHEHPVVLILVPSVVAPLRTWLDGKRGIEHQTPDKVVHGVIRMQLLPEG